MFVTSAQFGPFLLSMRPARAHQKAALMVPDIHASIVTLAIFGIIGVAFTVLFARPLTYYRISWKARTLSSIDTAAIGGILKAFGAALAALCKGMRCAFVGLALAALRLLRSWVCAQLLTLNPALCNIRHLVGMLLYTIRTTLIAPIRYTPLLLILARAILTDRAASINRVRGLMKVSQWLFNAALCAAFSKGRIGLLALFLDARNVVRQPSGLVRADAIFAAITVAIAPAFVLVELIEGLVSIAFCATFHDGVLSLFRIFIVPYFYPHRITIV